MAKGKNPATPILLPSTLKGGQEPAGENAKTLQGTSICFLGTNSAMPCAYRNVSACAIRFAESSSWFLVDVGEATQHQILHDSAVSLGDVKVILITHLHGDHCWGLPGLLASRSLLSKKGPGEEKDKEENPHPNPPSSSSSSPSNPLHTSNPSGEKLIIIGPVGVRKMCSVLYSLSETYIQLGVEWIELEEGKNHDLGLVEGISIKAYPLTHPVPTFGYVFQEKEKRGKFNAPKAKSLGIPPKLFSKLTGDPKKGTPPEAITLENGTVVQPEEVMGEAILGRKYVILGDTSNSDAVAEEVKGCTAVVHESTFDESKEEEAVAKGHSTTKMAAKFADKIDAEVLILNHFSARYTPEDTQNFAEEAKQYFHGNAHFSKKKRHVIVSYDHMGVGFGFNTE
mmetsp:Transcript_31641/g.49458  ORF Transcript_31641/g.49458 Transcript_31641/m.49458 type:complete len:397 (-) Transcript_31641:24-1214(-)